MRRSGGAALPDTQASLAAQRGAALLLLLTPSSPPPPPQPAQITSILIAVFILFACWQLFNCLRKGLLAQHPLFAFTANQQAAGAGGGVEAGGAAGAGGAYAPGAYPGAYPPPAYPPPAQPAPGYPKF